MPSPVHRGKYYTAFLNTLANEQERRFLLEAPFPVLPRVLGRVECRRAVFWP